MFVSAYSVPECLGEMSEWLEQKPPAENEPSASTPQKTATASVADVTRVRSPRPTAGPRKAMHWMIFRTCGVAKVRKDQGRN